MIEENGCQGKCGGKCGRCNIDAGIAKAFEDHGTPIGYGTPKCKKWLREHENDCSGCPNDLGCKKYSALIQIQEHYDTAVKRLIEIKTPAEFKIFEEEFGEKEEE